MHCDCHPRVTQYLYHLVAAHVPITHTSITLQYHCTYQYHRAAGQGYIAQHCPLRADCDPFVYCCSASYCVRPRGRRDTRYTYSKTQFRLFAVYGRFLQRRSHIAAIKDSHNHSPDQVEIGAEIILSMHQEKSSGDHRTHTWQVLHSNTQLCC